ncbi:unnamed protein product [Brachionus calyciflorus]|uniref:Uncharacterized protein n=1 Tax=Brachionus calyciflorus TaxID=104777 RepID=A0A813QEC5_9BILA|nr:unnamed protein product [Brachionus calyciflorus]
MAVRLNQSNLNVSNQTLNIEYHNVSFNSKTDSLKLANKIRKIKENLDQCHLNTNSNLNKSLNSTICSNSNLNDSVSRSSRVNSPSVYNTTKTSKYILVNHQNFDFELNNNPISLDNLSLEQFSEKISSDRDLIKNNGIQNVKHAVYSENVSRQSSIRSLITEKNSKFLPNTSVANMNNNFAKIKKFKAKSQANIEFKEYERDEVCLLNDWEKSNNPYEDSPVIENRKPPPRPSTRLGFQNDLVEWNSNNLEYSDNVTVASSSSSSNSKYQDFTEEYESILLTPQKSDNSQFTNGSTDKKKQTYKNLKKNDETESILSDLVTNLHFDDQKSTSYNSNFKLKEFQHEFDIQTTSDAYSDDNSLSLNNYNRLGQPSPSSSNMASVVIREKKIAQTKKLKNPTNNALNESLLMTKLQNHINTSLNGINPLSLNEDEKEQNYKRLSNTINNLFTNLIDNLEKQKNKDYLNEIENSDYSKYINSSVLNSSNYSIPKNKALANSNKDSNKDSGFNQELSSLNESKNQQQFRTNSQSCEIDSNLIRSKLKSFEFSTQAFNNDSNELSLMDRFLYNEQMVTEKNSKIEAVLQAFFYQNNMTLEDYSIIDYILNQEGISIKTFKQLIKEKYFNIEWPNELLLFLHQVVNERDSSTSESLCLNENIDQVSIYEDEFSIKSSEIETRLNTNGLSKSLIKTENVDFSPSSSTRSYRRLKEIKNSMNSRKRQNFLETSEEENVNNLKKSLNNSFAKRRERKGSLPEIVANPNDNLNDMQTSHCSIDSNMTLLNISKNDVSQRQSRKGAFVLESLRTSMFRSKSLTDLNNSLIKFDNNTSAQTRNTMMINSDNYNNTHKSIGANLNSIHLNTSGFSFVKYQVNDAENYTGLIWQCADMCYPEHKNKYKEFGWLMNGDKISIKAKLNEVQQRLTIEKNLKEKNLGLLEELNNNCDINQEKNSDKQMRERLINQLKVINDKIKELENMRLFVRICEINSYSLSQEDMEKFFQSPFNNSNDSNNNLQKAKSFLDIIKMLYGNEAICNGFVYQFFVTYRYICSSAELLEYFKQIFDKASNCLDISKNKAYLVLERTIDLIAMWLDGFFTIDFHQNQELLENLEYFLKTEIKSYDEKKQKILISLLQNPNIEFNLFSKKTKYFEKINEKYRKQESESVKKPRLFNGAAIKKRILNSSANLQKRARSSSKSKSMERSQYESRNQDELNTTTSSTIRIDFLLSDFTIDKIASQLTLLEWDNFLDIHVCHCLNSKAQGVNCDSKQPIDPNIINNQSCLFVDNYLSKSVYKMIQLNYLLTHWVAAEILMTDSVKNQALMIMKFLKIAKLCCDWTNFSSAFSIFEGLQDITIRNLPAWQHVSNKSIQTMEKIISFKILFQNDPFAIYNLTKTTNLPVIPPMHLFLLIVQQNEHGNFQLANGLWKWTKLGFLANLVDQIRNVQQHYECNLEPCEEFIENLLQRIYYLKDFDLNNLAETSFLDYQSQKLNSKNEKYVQECIDKYDLNELNRKMGKNGSPTNMLVANVKTESCFIDLIKNGITIDGKNYEEEPCVFRPIQSMKYVVNMDMKNVTKHPNITSRVYFAKKTLIGEFSYICRIRLIETRKCDRMYARILEKNNIKCETIDNRFKDGVEAKN